MKNILSLTIMLSLFILIPQQALAADPGCKPIYNGGVTSQQVCNGVISTPGSNAQPTAKATPTPVKLQSGSTTKGGLTVLSPAPAKNTPSTGPEVLGIMALLPAGALGYFLRKKVSTI